MIDTLSGRELSVSAGRVYDGEASKGLAFLAQAGVESFELDADELARWREATSGVIEGWLNDTRSRGGESLYQLLQQMLQER